MGNEHIIDWNKKNTKQIPFRFNIIKDKDIINRLDSVPNKSRYIKDLIRKDIKKRGTV